MSRDSCREKVFSSIPSVPSSLGVRRFDLGNHLPRRRSTRRIRRRRKRSSRRRRSMSRNHYKKLDGMNKPSITEDIGRADTVTASMLPHLTMRKKTIQMFGCTQLLKELS